MYQDTCQSSTSGGSGCGGSGTVSNCNICGGGGSGSGGSKSDSKFVFNSDSAVPRHINVVVITPEKITAAARRRYESQV